MMEVKIKWEKNWTQLENKDKNRLETQNRKKNGT